MARAAITGAVVTGDRFDYFTREFRQSIQSNYVYPGLCGRRYQPAFDAGAEEVLVFALDVKHTHGTYTRGMEMPAPTAVGLAKRKISMTQSDVITLSIDIEDERETTVAALDGQIAGEARVKAIAVDTYIGKQIDAGLRTTGANSYEIARILTSTDAVGSATVATAEAGGLTLLHALRRLRAKMEVDESGFSPSAPSPVWCVMHPEAISDLTAALIKNQVPWEPVASSAVRNGFAGRMMGIDILRSPRVPKKVASTVLRAVFCPVGITGATEFADRVVAEQYIPASQNQNNPTSNVYNSVYRYDSWLMDYDFMYGIQYGSYNTLQTAD